MFGIRDDELYLRWVQYGVFSPINRLHSSNSDLSGKEPWSYRADVDHFATEALKFRHKLIPYIYTMNYKTHTEGRAICEPMYYAYPDEKDAFKVKINICSEANLWCVRLSAVSTKHGYGGGQSVASARQMDGYFHGTGLSRRKIPETFPRRIVNSRACKRRRDYPAFGRRRKLRENPENLEF